MKAKRLTLNQIQLLAWALPALLGMMTCFAYLVGVSKIQQTSQTKAMVETFVTSSQKAFRRIESEIAVGNGQAVTGLAHDFEARNNSIDKISFSLTKPAECSGKKTCLITENGKAVRFYETDTKQGSQIIAAEVALPSLWQNFQMKDAWWLILMIFGLTGIGIVAQRFITKKYIVKPISNLVEQSKANSEIPTHYPIEIEKLALELNDSIKARDQVIISQLASGVIHDLKTQIQSMLSALALVKESENNPENKTKTTNMLLRASERNLPRMLRIIDTTLDGSRTIELSSKSSDIKESLIESIDDCKELANTRNVQIDYSNVQSKNLNFDSVQMERVFSNLVKNAIEAFDEEGFSSTFRKIRISAKDLVTHVEVSVEDSGPGLKIPTNDLFRLSQTTKPTGAGLGLLISRRIVEAHKGRIEAGTSQDLKGARFTVVLPTGGVQ